MLIQYFSNNLDIYDYVGKLPKQHFSVGLFSNPGDQILFLLKFHEARISVWNIWYGFIEKNAMIKSESGPGLNWIEAGSFFTAAQNTRTQRRDKILLE